MYQQPVLQDCTQNAVHSHPITLEVQRNVPRQTPKPFANQLRLLPLEFLWVEAPARLFRYNVETNIAKMLAGPALLAHHGSASWSHGPARSLMQETYGDNGDCQIQCGFSKPNLENKIKIIKSVYWDADFDLYSSQPLSLSPSALSAAAVSS